jgi:hypothetical protein
MTCCVDGPLSKQTNKQFVENNKIEHPQDIANTLPSAVSCNSSQEHYSKNFQKFQAQQEKRSLKFQSD